MRFGSVRVALPLMVGGLVAMLTVGAAGAEDLTDEKKAAIREMMVVSGEEQRVAVQLPILMSEMFDLVQPSDDVSAEEILLLREEIRVVVAETVASGAFMDVYAELTYPVFHEYFTLEDLRGLIAFYRSEAGMKWVKVSTSPEFSRDMMAISAPFGERLRLADLAVMRVRARQGVARAQCELAELYREGGLLPQNHAEAARWSSRAAARGGQCSQRR